MLNKNEGDKLLKLARNSIQSYFSGEKLNLADLHNNPKFNKELGVFVTLKKQGELRGCIGFPYPTTKLYEAVFDAARHAAFEDPRFQQLTEEEIDDIKIEISVLTEPKEIDTDYANIEIGKDGLIVQTKTTTGLLLPQVFIEHESTPEEALRMTCQKAGLPEDDWKKDSTKVLKFQAQVFEEK